MLFILLIEFYVECYVVEGCDVMEDLGFDNVVLIRVDLLYFYWWFNNDVVECF